MEKCRVVVKGADNQRGDKKVCLLGIRLCLSFLTSRSMISIGSSTKLSLSSSRSSFIGMTRDSSDWHFFRLET
nr:hypothetical protein [Tanacetum cinerariifolium]